MKYISRLIEETVIETSGGFKVVFLGGPRQVGKTTLLKKLVGERGYNYVTLDDINLRELAKSDPELFLQQFPRPLVIDEVQYAPQLFAEIKKLVDTTSENGQYWLTGSQQFDLIRNLQESLAGRVGILNLLGLSQGELSKTKQDKSFSFEAVGRKLGREKPDINRLFERIFEGSMPAFWQEPKPDRDVFFNSYIQTYIDRDLVDIFGVTKTSEFNRFMQVCAARTGQVINISEMARDTGVSVHAAREWLSILRSSHQVYLLKPYFANFTKRVIKSPKLYFLDTGLASYLTRWKTPSQLRWGAMAGAMYESYIVGEMIKSYWYRGKQLPIYYFRDREGHEVDVVIEKAESLDLVEIKMSSKIDRNQTRNLEYVAERLKRASRKLVVSSISQPITGVGGVKFVPYTLVV